ncbi:MAG: 4Fe-4S binding protein [Lachnospiraceae bacterium]|nr:4Fe-4S binding protein [Lachnospiraceae bacterium]
MISEACVMCGRCTAACPVAAITEGDGKYQIDPRRCIDCGTCSYVCPFGAPQPV